MIVNYVAEGALGRTLTRDCYAANKPRSPDGLYEMEVCYIAGNAQDGGFDGIARLRSAKDGTVLAEAEVHNPSISQVYWEANDVSVGAGDGYASINLPPSWLDRLRAKLP
ncbi:hypothetical protein WKW80_36465 [Variovorax humicola]|uniref:Uncharacterized protein n=1 Tax=Variovorax humicola TaxID=1769758 RepID=A0ABU8WBW1_9BURK